MTCKTKRSLTTSRGRRTTSMLCLWWTRSESRSNNHLGPWCPPLQLDTVLLWCWFQRGRNNLGSSLFAKLRLTVLGSLRHYNVHEPYVSRIVTRSKQKKLKISPRKLVALQLIDHTLCLRCWHTFSSENAKQQFATATDLRFNSISCCARAFITKVPTRFGQKEWHLRLPTSSLNNRSKPW